MHSLCSVPCKVTKRYALSTIIKRAERGIDLFLGVGSIYLFDIQLIHFLVCRFSGFHFLPRLSASAVHFIPALSRPRL